MTEECFGTLEKLTMSFLLTSDCSYAGTSLTAASGYQQLNILFSDFFELISLPQAAPAVRINIRQITTFHAIKQANSLAKGREQLTTRQIQSSSHSVCVQTYSDTELSVHRHWSPYGEVQTFWSPKGVQRCVHDEHDEGLLPKAAWQDYTTTSTAWHQGSTQKCKTRWHVSTLQTKKHRKYVSFSTDNGG